MGSGTLRITVNTFNLLIIVFSFNASITAARSMLYAGMPQSCKPDIPGMP